MSDAEKLQSKCEELADELQLYTASELRRIYSSEAYGAKWGDFDRLLRRIDRAGLDIFRDQAYIVRREDDGEVVIEFRSSIQALRMRADSTGKYAGQEGPWWTDDGSTWHDVWLKDEPPNAAMVHVLRSDFETPMRGVAKFEEYAARYSRSGDLMNMWAEMPAHMIAKCAEALAIKRAFPQKTGGILTRAEMHRDDEDGANQRDMREPADAHEETARDVEEVNQALDLGGASGDGAAEQQTPDPNDDLGIGEPSDPKQAAEKPLDPEAATGGERTSGSAMSDEEQSEAKQAAQERAEQNGAPERTISTGEGSQLNLLFAKGVHGGPFTKDALKKMVRREFGYEELDAIQAQDFDRVLEHAQDEALASKYIGDPDTKDLFEGEDEGEEEDLDLSGWDVSETEEQQLRDAYEKVDRTLAATDVLEERVVHANGFLHAVEGEPGARRSAVEQAVEGRGVKPVPQDFPHRERLHAAGLYTLQTVHDNLRNNALTAIDGIGEKREAEIEQQIGHCDFDPLPVMEPTGEPEGPPNDEAFADDPAEDDAVPL
jgi:phage recombination protein Bet